MTYSLRSRDISQSCDKSGEEEASTSNLSKKAKKRDAKYKQKVKEEKSEQSNFEESKLQNKLDRSIGIHKRIVQNKSKDRQKKDAPIFHVLMHQAVEKLSHYLRIRRDVDKLELLICMNKSLFKERNKIEEYEKQINLKINNQYNSFDHYEDMEERARIFNSLTFLKDFRTKKITLNENEIQSHLNYLCGIQLILKYMMNVAINHNRANKLNDGNKIQDKVVEKLQHLANLSERFRASNEEQLKNKQFKIIC